MLHNAQNWAASFRSLPITGNTSVDFHVWAQIPETSPSIKYAIKAIQFPRIDQPLDSLALNDASHAHTHTTYCKQSMSRTHTAPMLLVVFVPFLSEPVLRNEIANISILSPTLAHSTSDGTTGHE